MRLVETSREAKTSEKDAEPNLKALRIERVSLNSRQVRLPDRLPVTLEAFDRQSKQPIGYCQAAHLWLELHICRITSFPNGTLRFRRDQPHLLAALCPGYSRQEQPPRSSYRISRRTVNLNFQVSFLMSATKARRTRACDLRMLTLQFNCQGSSP